MLDPLFFREEPLHPTGIAVGHAPQYNPRDFETGFTKTYLKRIEVSFLDKVGAVIRVKGEI